LRSETLSENRSISCIVIIWGCKASFATQARPGVAPHAKNAGRTSLLPARFVMKLRRRKPRVKARSSFRLGTDSVNPFRQQKNKTLVSVALKPQTAWLARKLYSPRSAALGRMYAERGP
jgi:hypothetical protein